MQGVLPPRAEERIERCRGRKRYCRLVINPKRDIDRFDVMVRADIALLSGGKQPHALCAELIPSKVRSGGGIFGVGAENLFKQRLELREGSWCGDGLSRSCAMRISRQTSLLNFGSGGT